MSVIMHHQRIAQHLGIEARTGGTEWASKTLAAYGQPLTKESFGTMFREACREAGVEKSAHGVRKIGATTAANNGATVAELEAIFGWSGGQMAALYTRAADRKRLARPAMHKLTRTAVEYPIPAPTPKVRG